MKEINYQHLIDEANVYSVAAITELQHAPLLSSSLQNGVYLKREDLQKTFSFKIRGAINKLNNIDIESLKNGIICSSAGNHAQGVALAAKIKSVSATVVMPITTPSIKVNAVRSLGAEVILHGDNFDEAFMKAKSIEKDRSLIFIHPFDDPHVIAGQGTIGKEILNQIDSDIDAIFVPIGGGGLISGIAAYIKESKSNIKIIGVEPHDSASMKVAIEAGKPVELESVGIFSDGVAVKLVGDETFKLCKKYVDEIITVDTDEICAAIQSIYEETRSIVEPAGAIAVAGISNYVSKKSLKGKKFIAINCGANVNFDRLRHIAERASIGKRTEMLLAVEIEEKPGSFKSFCESLGKRNITEFNYRFNNKQEKARVFVGLSTNEGSIERKDVIKSIDQAGYSVIDLSDNEMAKLHIRHMVGGNNSTENEHLFRFEFPERPGALMEFLNSVGEEWNISLFHYRNHGSDFGRVLAGIQASTEEMNLLKEHLSKLGYRYWEETDNPAYTMFLA